MARTKIPGTRREILEDGWRLMSGGGWSFQGLSKFADLERLLLALYGKESDAVAEVLSFVEAEVYAARLQEIGPWHPADVLRLHPYAFGAGYYIASVLNETESVKFGTRVRAEFAPEKLVTHELPGYGVNGPLRLTQRKPGAIPDRLRVDRTSSRRNPDASRETLARVAGALQSFRDGGELAVRVWRALDLRDEVAALAVEVGSTKQAFRDVARRHDFASGAALKKEVQRALDAFREVLAKPGSIHPFLGYVRERLGETFHDQIARDVRTMRETWGTPPPVPHKPAGTAPGVPLPARKTSSGASTRAKGGRHDELPHDNRNRRPAQGAATNSQVLEGQRQGAAILQAVRKPRALRGRGADSVPRGSDVRTHGRGDDSSRKRPGRVKEPP